MSQITLGAHHAPLNRRSQYLNLYVLWRDPAPFRALLGTQHLNADGLLVIIIRSADDAGAFAFPIDDAPHFNGRAVTILENTGRLYRSTLLAET